MHLNITPTSVLLFTGILSFVAGMLFAIAVDYVTYVKPRDERAKESTRQTYQRWAQRDAERRKKDEAVRIGYAFNNDIKYQ